MALITTLVVVGQYLPLLLKSDDLHLLIALSINLTAGSFTTSTLSKTNSEAFAEVKVETGKGGRGWEEEERAGEMVWASHTAGGRRESEEELVAGNGRGGRRVEEVFIKLGSQLRLICHLRRATSKPTFLFWCHLISAIFTTSYQPFSHHQGSVDFNTVNATGHLIHPWG